MWKLLQSEFIESYCYKSDITENKLNKLGLCAVPCNCGEESCRGWAMVTRENMKHHTRLYAKPWVMDID